MPCLAQCKLIAFRLPHSGHVRLDCDCAGKCLLRELLLEAHNDETNASTGKRHNRPSLDSSGSGCRRFQTRDLSNLRPHDPNQPRDLTFFTMPAASIPKCASNSPGLPERGSAVTASLWTLI